MKKTVDGLYLVIGRENCVHYSLQYIVQQACLAGVGCVQLREKNISDKEYISLAMQIRQITQEYDTTLIINDNVAVAVAVDACGVHIGQDDVKYEYARKILGSDKIIGLSAATTNEIKLANSLDIDYVGVGAIFATQTKKNVKNIVGIDGLQMAVKLSKHKVVAIGGINLYNIAKVAAVCQNIAVVSAVAGSIDPKLSVEKLNILTKNA
jgi:thiamine-phosphate pyrophosphorylase